MATLCEPFGLSFSYAINTMMALKKYTTNFTSLGLSFVIYINKRLLCKVSPREFDRGTGSFFTHYDIC